MKKSALYLLAAAFLAVGANAGAEPCTGIPDLDFSIVRQSHQGWATLLVLPDGSGFPLTAARTPDGLVVDATIHLTLVDHCNGLVPVVNFPREDMWLDTVGGGLALCRGGSIADANTDQDGNARWSQPLSGGGWDDGICLVMVNGVALGAGTGLTLNFNSADLDGNLSVNLTDLALFVQDYFGPYAFRSDLARDGTLNLSDLAVMAAAMGKSCP
jgi:hypothetical protein